jgi:hypothetical protein
LLASTCMQRRNQLDNWGGVSIFIYSVNMNIWIWTPPNYLAGYAAACMNELFLFLLIYTQYHHAMTMWRTVTDKLIVIAHASTK